MLTLAVKFSRQCRHRLQTATSMFTVLIYKIGLMSTEVLKNHAPVIFGLSRGLLLFLNSVLEFLSGSRLNLDTGFRLGCTVTFHPLKKLLRNFLRGRGGLAKKSLSNFFNGWNVTVHPRRKPVSKFNRDPERKSKTEFKNSNNPRDNSKITGAWFLRTSMLINPILYKLWTSRSLF